MSGANLVIKNTGFLYIKMIVSIIISLYSTRLILSALGVEDYGIFTVIAGVIGMLNFLNSAMSVSTQRYLSFNIGSGDFSMLKSVFFSSVVLHLVIGLFVILLFEVAAMFLFDGALNIPEDRISSAKIVYQFMIISVFITINAVPYDAAIIAHENLLYESLIGIIESVLKLAVAILLISYNGERLVLYGILICCVTLTTRILKSFYCLRKYKETRKLRFKDYDHSLIKEMFAFAGWNLFGAFCHVLRNQGIAITLNIFFSVVVNAAYGIANQVNGQLSAFSANMMKALNPQIIKSEGGNDRDRMLRLSMLGSKVSLLLLSFFAIPLIIEMEYVLSIWLKEVPENAVLFCRLIILYSLVAQFTIGLRSAIQSTGIIRNYQIVVGTLLILNLPMSIVLLKLNMPAHVVFYSMISFELIAGGFRIYFAHRIAQLPVYKFIRDVILRSLLVIVVSGLIAFLPNMMMGQSFLRLLAVGASSSILLLIAGYFIALTTEEKKRFNNIISSFKLNKHDNSE